jgi:hypothetical protein
MRSRKPIRDIVISHTKGGQWVHWKLLDPTKPPSDVDQTFRITNVPSGVLDEEVLTMVQKAHHGGPLDPSNYSPQFEGVARSIMLSWDQLNALTSPEPH